MSITLGVTPAAASTAAVAADRAGAGIRAGALLRQVRRPGLAPLLLALVVLVAAVASGGVGWALLQSSREALRSQILASNLGAADLAAISAARYVEAAEAVLRETAARPTVVDALKDGDHERLQAGLVRVVQASPNLSGITIIDLRGAPLVTSSNDNVAGISLADRDYFKGVLATGEPALGAPTLSRLNGRRALPYGVPIHDEEGVLLAVLVGGVSLDALADTIAGLHVSDYGRATLVDRRDGGLVMAHVDHERIMKHPETGTEVIARLLAGARGVLETHGRGGQEAIPATLAVFAPVQGLPWSILIEEPSTAAFAPVEAMAGRALRFGLLAVACALALGLPLAAWIHRLENRLALRGEELAASNASLEVELTERQRTEQALLAANSDLQQFAYTVSHDLKAPLVSIQGYATRLEEEHGTLLAEHDGGRGARYLERIRVNADRLSTLITDVLEYSRLGRTDVTAQSVPLTRLVAEATAALQHQLDQSGGAVTVVTPLPVVYGSPTGLRQIVGNLVENGIKYGGAAPSSSAAELQAQPPRVEVGADELATQWRLWVKDNGPGIAPALHDQVFRLFSRLPDGKRRDPDGTGVGLATVKRAAEQLGGNVWLESDPNVAPGATFFVTLPKAPPGPAPASA